MGKRRKARELALQVLYELDLRADADPGDTLKSFWERQPAPDEVRSFTETLVRGTKEHQDKIDPAMEQISDELVRVEAELRASRCWRERRG